MLIFFSDSAMNPFSKNILRLLIILTIATACEKPITLDVDQIPPRVVIEGLLTDVPGYQSVKVTRTADFYTVGKTPRITNATVTITDDLGESIAFVHNPRNHPDSAGIYLPVTPFVGTVGRTYRLRVEADGEVYESLDTMYPNAGLDSLSYQVNEDQLEDPKDWGKIYELLLFAHDPTDQENFYLFKFYRNDSLVFFFHTDVYVTDDALLAGDVDGFPSPVFYGLGDQARIEFFSLSRNGYVYFYDLWSVLNNDAGGMFGPVPASPRTNLTNDALGFFQVSSLDISEIRIE